MTIIRSGLPLLLVLGVASVAMPQPAPRGGRTASGDADAIRAVGKTYAAAVDAGDLDRWVETFAEDAIVLPPDQPLVTGRAAIREWVKQSFFDPFKMQLSFSFADVVVAGDWAFTHGPYTLRLTPKDGRPAVEGKGKFVNVFRRRPNGWRYARVIWNSDSPPGGRP